MIKINDKICDNYEIKITYGTFNVSSYGKKRTGISPFIEFIIDNNIFIGLELTYSIDMFNNLDINKKININDYISDITYEDINGWQSIVTGKYTSSINKIDSHKYHLIVSAKEENISLYIDETLEISVNPR